MANNGAGHFREVNAVMGFRSSHSHVSHSNQWDLVAIQESLPSDGPLLSSDLPSIQVSLAQAALIVQSYEANNLRRKVVNSMGHGARLPFLEVVPFQ